MEQKSVLSDKVDKNQTSYQVDLTLTSIISRNRWKVVPDASFTVYWKSIRDIFVYLLLVTQGK